MATNELEEEQPSRTEQLRSIFGEAADQIVGGTRTELPLRVFLALMVAAACMVWAPLPANVIGILALLAMTIWIPGRKR